MNRCLASNKLLKKEKNVSLAEDVNSDALKILVVTDVAKTSKN